MSGRGVTLTTHPHLVPSSRMSYISSPPSAFMACCGTDLALVSYPALLYSGRGMTLTTHAYLMPRSRMSRSFLSPLVPVWRLRYGFTLTCRRSRILPLSEQNSDIVRQGSQPFCMATRQFITSCSCVVHVFGMRLRLILTDGLVAVTAELAIAVTGPHSSRFTPKKTW
jgi:hypothetical protein